MRRKGKHGVMKALIALVLAGIVAYGAVVAAVCVSAGTRYPPVNADCVIVLGARVWPEGQPSNALLYRCESALEAWREGRVSAMILCGGQGGNEPMTEAACMRNWLVENGVSEDALYLDEESENTVQNLDNAKTIMAAQGFRTAAVCTSDYHLRRALWIARDAGIDACGIAAASPRKVDSWIVGRLRESCSWILYWIRKIGG